MAHVSLTTQEQKVPSVEWKMVTAIALVQRGRPDEWSDCAMECSCYLRDVQDKMADGTTAFEKRFGKTSDGPYRCLLITG